jgi:hypothetical protein
MKGRMGRFNDGDGFPWDFARWLSTNRLVYDPCSYAIPCMNWTVWCSRVRLGASSSINCRSLLCFSFSSWMPLVSKSIPNQGNKCCMCSQKPESLSHVRENEILPVASDQNITTNYTRCFFCRRLFLKTELEEFMCLLFRKCKKSSKKKTRSVQTSWCGKTSERWLLTLCLLQLFTMHPEFLMFRLRCFCLSKKSYGSSTCVCSARGWKLLQKTEGIRAMEKERASVRRILHSKKTTTQGVDGSPGAKSNPII